MLFDNHSLSCHVDSYVSGETWLYPNFTMLSLSFELLKYATEVAEVDAETL